MSVITELVSLGAENLASIANFLPNIQKKYAKSIMLDTSLKERQQDCHGNAIKDTLHRKMLQRLVKSERLL